MSVSPDGLLSCPDGADLGLIECAPVDLGAMEPWRQHAVRTAFEHLLRSLETDLHIGVHVRRLTAADVDPTPATGKPIGIAAMTPTMDRHDAAITNRLSDALQRHLHAHVESNPPVLRRRIVIGARGDRETVTRQLTSIAETLAGAGIESRRLVLKEATALVADLGLIGDQHWSDGRSALTMGSTVLRGLALTRLPGIPVSSGWLTPLLLVDAPCDIGVRISPTDSRGALRLLSRRMRDLGAHRLLEAERGIVPDAGIAGGYDAASQLRERLANNAARPLRLSVTAVARDEGVSSTGWRRVRAAMAATMSTGSPAHFGHRDAAMLTWGIGSTQSGENKLMDSAAAATCLPFAWTEADDGDGYRLGEVLATRMPVRLNPFDARRYANANISIFAASGQGKSFLIGGLIIEAVRRGHDVILVDPEGEYRGLIEGLGGRWLDLASDAPINPFDLGDDADPYAGVAEVCSVLAGGMSDFERAEVHTAARRVAAMPRAVGDVPLLADCAPLLDHTAPRLATLIRSDTEGRLRGLLGSPTSTAWDSPVLAIGHREIRDELIPITTLVLARLLWKRVREDPRPRHIVLDEVGMLSGHAALRGLLAQLARRCRKYGSSLVVATQNVQDLLRTDDGKVVAANCAVTFCGGHRALEAEAMTRTFGLTEQHQRFIERASRGEFVMVAGTRRAGIRVVLPRMYGELICRPPG